MANNKPIKIPVTLDKPRHFILDLAAVIRWEGLTNKPFFSNKTWKHFKKKEDMMMMLWCLLVGDDPGLKPEDITRIFNEGKINPETALPAFIESLSAAWGTVIINLVGGE